MSNTEVRALGRELCEAEDMRDFWEECGVEGLGDVQANIENLSYELLSKYPKDAEAIHEIVFKLAELIKIAKEHFEYWQEKYEELEEEEAKEDGDDGYPPYMPYDCSFDPAPEPFDYVALGMGI